MVGVLGGAAPAVARDAVLEVTLHHEAERSDLELCAWDDDRDLPVPDEAVDRIVDRWPAVDRSSADEDFGCVYLEVSVERTGLPTGDGFVARVEVPALDDLTEQGFAELWVSVCSLAVEVTTEVEPPAARLDGDACILGSRGTGLDPSTQATVTVTARASDAFVWRRVLLVTAFLAGIGIAAGLAVASRRRLAVRWVDAPTWRWWTWGLLTGAGAGVAAAFAALTVGLVEAVHLRFGFGPSVAVAAVAGAVAFTAVLGATLAIARVRGEPAVVAEARRRGFAAPSAADVPADLHELRGPPDVHVPPAPWWSAMVSHGPPTLLWAAGLAALWIDQPEPYAVPAIGIGVAGALLLWVRAPLVLRSLRSEELDPDRRAAMLAVAAEIGAGLRDVRQATVSLPSDGDGPAMGVVVGRSLHLSPVLADRPPRRALLVAVAASAEPAGLVSAWFGAGALMAGALIDLAWGELAWWAVVPAALLLLYTLRWWWQGRGVRPRADGVPPDELLAADLEASWWSLAQLETGWGAPVDDDGEDRDVTWRLAVAAAREHERELGASPGTAVATARRLTSESAHREQDGEPTPGPSLR